MHGHEINQLATWLSMKSDEILVKKMPEGYPYTVKGILMNSTVLRPIYRYAKNYEIGGRKVSLCVISPDSEISNVESWMDQQSELISLAEIIKPFTKLDRYYK